MKRKRVAIITGISRGIGEETAVLLSKEGILIVGNYWKDDKNAQRVKTRIENMGNLCVLIKGDLKRHTVINKIVNTTIEKFGQIDFLINNASHYERLQIDQITTKEFVDMLKENIVSPFLLIQQTVPFMRMQKFGKIINISSAVAIKGYNYSCHYMTAKSGLIGLTKSLALELAPFIRVNCIAPGYINTSLISQDSESQRLERLSKIPLASIGSPKDVANVISFLLKDESNYITGEIIKVSGGF